MASPYTFQHISKLVPRSPAIITVIIILTSAVDSTTWGYDGSLMGSLNAMNQYTGYFHLTTATIGLNSSITFVGGAVSALMAAPLSDWRGRWQVMVLAANTLIIGAVIQTAAPNIAAFIIGRFFIGMGGGFGAVAAVTYAAETAPPKWRAMALGLFYTCWAVGTLIASGVCYGTQTINSTWAWRLPSLIQVAPPILALALLPFLPESPRWLISNDQNEHALEVLMVTSGASSPDDPVVQVQYREIVDQIAWERSQGKSLGFIEIVKTATARKRLILAVSMAPLSMLTGSNIITYYFSTMLEQAGITSAHTQLEINIILSAWQLVIAVLGSMLAERIGRKTLCIGSLTGSAVFFFMLGGLTAKYGESDDQAGIYGTIACLFLFLGAYSFGITPLTVMYAPEVLTFASRATGCAVLAFTSRVCGIFVSWVFPFALEAIGWKTYMINAAFDVLCAVWVWWYWVETSGKTLEEVDECFEGKHSDVPDLAMVLKGKEAAIEQVYEMRAPSTQIIHFSQRRCEDPGE